MCDFEAAQKICTLEGYDSELSNSEQLFNRQFLSLSNSTDELCQKAARVGFELGDWKKRRAIVMAHFGQIYCWSQVINNDD